ncbi:MAG: hypothetical protein OXE99_00320, partial [Cellvibrionales bacterium]|nr:hypothetical protein [Cellvibrionales bacterium]
SAVGPDCPTSYSQNVAIPHQSQTKDLVDPTSWGIFTKKEAREAQNHVINTAVSKNSFTLSAQNDFDGNLTPITLECSHDILNQQCSCCNKPMSDISMYSATLDEIFDKECTFHHIRKGDKTDYVKLFHGTKLENFDSFKIEGIKPIGKGVLGNGFYLTSSPLAACQCGDKKREYVNNDVSQPHDQPDNRPPLLLIEFLIPASLTVYAFNEQTLTHSQNAHIFQHHQEPNKFIFKEPILDQLKVNQYYTAN